MFNNQSLQNHPVPTDDEEARAIPTDEERAHLKELEGAYLATRRALDAQMTKLYPERGPRRMTDEEAYAEIEPFAARSCEAEVALQEARSKFAPPWRW